MMYVISLQVIDIYPSSCVRNLSAQFDNKLSISTHVTKICNAAFYHLHNTRRIKKYLSLDVQTIVMDFCMAFLTRKQLNCNVCRQNAAARLVLSLRKYSHISPALYQLHWLPGPGCIKPALKCSLKYVTYESVMGTLTGVAQNTLSTLVSFCFTW